MKEMDLHNMVQDTRADVFDARMARIEALLLCLAQKQNVDPKTYAANFKLCASEPSINDYKQQIETNKNPLTSLLANVSRSMVLDNSFVDRMYDIGNWNTEANYKFLSAKEQVFSICVSCKSGVCVIDVIIVV